MSDITPSFVLKDVDSGARGSIPAAAAGRVAPLFIMPINYVGIRAGFENTSKNGIMCLLGRRFSVGPPN